MDEYKNLFKDINNCAILLKSGSTIESVRYLPEYGLLTGADENREIVNTNKLNENRIDTNESNIDLQKGMVIKWIEENVERKRTFINAYAALLIVNQDILGFELNYPRVLFCDYDQLKKFNSPNVFKNKNSIKMNIRDYDRIIIFNAKKDSCDMYIFSISSFLEKDLFKIGYNTLIYSNIEKGKDMSSGLDINDLSKIICKMFSMPDDYLVRSRMTDHISGDGSVLELCYVMSQYSKNLEELFVMEDFKTLNLEQAISHLNISVIPDFLPVNPDQREFVPPDPYVTKERLEEAISYSSSTSTNSPTTDYKPVSSRQKSPRKHLFNF